MVVSVIRGGPNYLRRGRRGRLRQNDAVHAIGGPAAWNVRTALCFKMDQAGKENAAMLRAFFIPLCSLQNTLPTKVFFKFFKVQILSFFGKFAVF